MTFTFSRFFMLELMLLGLLSLLLAQWARGISEICVNSSLLTSRFYICSEMDFGIDKNLLFESTSSFPNETVIPPKGLNTHPSHQCGEVNYFSSSFNFGVSLLAVSLIMVERRAVNHLYH